MSEAQLNAAQRAAVEHGQGPLLLLAGAGSGKTRVVTQRIARLVRRGVRPESILAVSFTNKATREMLERLRVLLPGEAKLLWLSTFHSFGIRFLGEERSALGFDRFVIFDQGDSLGLVRELLKRHRSQERRLDAMAVHSRISLWKNAFVHPKDVPPSDVEYDAAAREIFEDYQAGLLAMRAVDFDDLVIRPVEILARSEQVRNRWRARFRHLLVDEFQDTNLAQFKLVRLLTNDLQNVCVVGDDDQSIYGWRGARVTNILEFDQYFRNVTVIKLEDNYRSRAPILNVANAVIGRAGHRKYVKTLRAARSGGEPVRLAVLDDVGEEAKFVARELRDLHRAGTAFHHMAVLFRSNTQARAIEEELRTHGVPYSLSGGQEFFDRKEVKDAAAYLRVVVNPWDELSLRRVVNTPPRGIGVTTMERVSRRALIEGISLLQAFERIHTMDDVPQSAKRGAMALTGLLGRARSQMRDGARVSAVVDELFERAGLRDFLMLGDNDTAGARRWENVRFLVQALKRYEDSDREGKPSLDQFLQRITMRMDNESPERESAVSLCTLHASKGLEFSVVFLVGCVEGVLPHTRTTDPKVSDASPTDVEEERRLFYVGVTRAMDRLYLTRPKVKMMRGKTEPVTPSRFLDGLPEASIEHYERNDETPLETTEAADMAASILQQLRS